MGDGFSALRIFFEYGERLFEMIFERVNTVEYAIVERLFTQVIPEMFDRIEFRRVRRQEQELNPNNPLAELRYAERAGYLHVSNGIH